MRLTGLLMKIVVLLQQHANCILCLSLVLQFPTTSKLLMMLYLCISICTALLMGVFRGANRM